MYLKRYHGWQLACGCFAERNQGWNQRVKAACQQSRKQSFHQKVKPRQIFQGLWQKGLQGLDKRHCKVWCCILYRFVPEMFLEHLLTKKKLKEHVCQWWQKHLQLAGGGSLHQTKAYVPMCWHLKFLYSSFMCSTFGPPCFSTEHSPALTSNLVCFWLKNSKPFWQKRACRHAWPKRHLTWKG